MSGSEKAVTGFADGGAVVCSNAREHPPCAFLASVVDAAEARVCLAGGVDIIDCKNPSAGALGALSQTGIRDIVREVGGVVPVSATVGDLPCEGQVLRDAVARTGALGVDFVKVGFFVERGDAADVGRQRIREAVCALGSLDVQGAQLVAVVLADRVFDLSLLVDFARVGFCGVIVDTADKSSGSLFDVLPAADIACIVETSRRLGLFCGLAGRLGLEDVPRALSFAPDIVGFRGALCVRGERRAGIDAFAVRDVRAAIAVPSDRTGRWFDAPRAAALVS